MINNNLVGGFNDLEKYESMGRIIPYMKWTIKGVWNHQANNLLQPVQKYSKEEIKTHWRLGKMQTSPANLGFLLDWSIWASTTVRFYFIRIVGSTHQAIPTSRFLWSRCYSVRIQAQAIICYVGMGQN